MQPNPFSTRFIQPGAIPYKCFDGSTVSDLVERFLRLPTKRGSIVGPHGSGKSTLVASIVVALDARRPETKIHSLRFSTDQFASRLLKRSVLEWTRSSVVILDGYEQLRLWSRLMVDWIARSRSISILATAHEPLRGFETIWETSVNEASSRWVVEQLLQQPATALGANALLQSDDWARSRAKHGQNLRESLFDMYDWWQQGSR
jgi:hypothetical protein